MRDRIFVTDLRLHGHHGVFPEEKRLGQKFHLDIECVTDFEACAAQDDYREAVCYGSLCELADHVSQAQNFNLIETLADRIAAAILQRFPTVSRVRVRVRKPSAPLTANVAHVAVEVERVRSPVAALIRQVAESGAPALGAARRESPV